MFGFGLRSATFKSYVIDIIIVKCELRNNILLCFYWAGALGYWLAPLPFTPEKQKMFLPHPRVKVSIVGSLRDREVACSASDRQGPNFESCFWRTVSSQ